jgi:DinB superfamily
VTPPLNIKILFSLGKANIMDASLQKLFSSIEQQRASLLGELKSAKPDSLVQGKNDKWSVSQIVRHLIIAERLSIGYINKKINAINEVGNTGMLSELKLVIFIVSQRLPIKYKAPASLGDQPTDYADMDALEKDWDDARADLKKLLENFPASGLKKKIYRHPVMGRCNILHALIFFREHIIHHWPQIKRQL